jgi:hypothetical protein
MDTLPLVNLALEVVLLALLEPLPTTENARLAHQVHTPAMLDRHLASHATLVLTLETKALQTATIAQQEHSPMVVRQTAPLALQEPFQLAGHRFVPPVPPAHTPIPVPAGVLNALQIHMHQGTHPAATIVPLERPALLVPSLVTQQRNKFNKFF